MAISIALAVMTLIAIGRSGTPLARCWPAAAAGVVVITPLLVWLTLHYRAAYPDTYGRWLLHEVNLRHPTEWAQSFTNRQMLATCSGAFWDFFSPTNLAMNADGPGFVGVLSPPIVILAGTGIYAARRPFGSDSMRVVSECIVIGPLVAAILRDSRAAQRALIIAPVTASLAAFGAAALLTSRHSFVRWFAIAMLVAVVVQFAAAYQGLVSASSVAWVQSPR
jgi:hypothetical protein